MKRTLLIVKEFVETGNLEFWTEKERPPNLPVEIFKSLLPVLSEQIPKSEVWKPRESNKGKNAHHGEDDCFFINIEKESILSGKVTEYFIKGYFWPKGRKREGVTIQSFRKE